MRVALPGDATQLENNLLRLVEKNRAFLSTMRVVVVRNRGGVWEAPNQSRSSDVIAFTADVKDWGESVKLNYMRQARPPASVFAGRRILACAMTLTLLEETP